MDVTAGIGGVTGAVGSLSTGGTTGSVTGTAGLITSFGVADGIGTAAALSTGGTATDDAVEIVGSVVSVDVVTGVGGINAAIGTVCSGSICEGDMDGATGTAGSGCGAGRFIHGSGGGSS